MCDYVNRAVTTVLAVACTAVLMTACGQKGPLTLPDKHAAVVTPPQAVPTTATPAVTGTSSVASPVAAPAAAPQQKKNGDDNSQK
jgi:predicted small lipoprotein YifL